MKSYTTISISILCSILFSGFIFEKKVDATNDESLKESISEIRKSLSTEKLKEFDEAIKILLFKDLDLKTLALGKFGADLEILKGKDNLNDKTANEIISEASKIKRERDKKNIELKRERDKKNQKTLNHNKEIEQKKKERLIKEIEILKTDIDEYNDLENEIKKIEYKVLNIEEKETYGKWLEIQVEVKNNSKYILSSITFDGKFLSSDRKVPWLEIKDIYSSIPGGLISNEFKVINFTTRLRKSLSDIPKDSNLVLEITSIRDENEKTYSLKSYSSFYGINYKKEQLKKLNKQFNDIKSLNEEKDLNDTSLYDIQSIKNKYENSMNKNYYIDSFSWEKSFLFYNLSVQIQDSEDPLEIDYQLCSKLNEDNFKILFNTYKSIKININNSSNEKIFTNQCEMK